MLNPRTPAEFMELNPGERLMFAKQLGEAVTPEVVALVIHTYVNTMMADRTRGVYREQLMMLIDLVDPVKLIVLADRYLSTSKASIKLRPMHQETMTVFADMLNRLGLHRSYVRRAPSGYFCGTLGRPFYPENDGELLAAGMKTDDAILYDPTTKHYNRTTKRYEVKMTLVPQNDDLPASLGL